MDEGDLETEHAVSRRLVDQLRAGLRETREGGAQVIDLVCDIAAEAAALHHTISRFDLGSLHRGSEDPRRMLLMLRKRIGDGVPLHLRPTNVCASRSIRAHQRAGREQRQIVLCECALYLADAGRRRAYSH